MNYNFFHKHKIHVTAIQETWLKMNDCIYFPNYKIIVINRCDGYGGIYFKK